MRRKSFHGRRPLLLTRLNRTFLDLRSTEFSRLIGIDLCSKSSIGSQRQPQIVELVLLEKLQQQLRPLRDFLSLIISCH